MNKAIELIKNPRAEIIKAIEGLSIQQLNEVPAGFNNNIIWNMGHLIAAQQGVCYRRSALDLKIDESFFNQYKPGTKPEGFINEAEVEKIKALLFTTLDELEADLPKPIFSNYTSVMTRYGVELASIDDAIRFLPFHEGLHIGYIMALKRVVAE